MRDRHVDEPLASTSEAEPFAPYVVRALWRPDITTLPRWKADSIKLARITYAVVRDVIEGRLTLYAGSLVYTTILSLVPILALAFSILKGFGVHYRFEPLLMEALSPLGTQAQEIAEKLMDFVSKMDVGVLGAVGLALLFYTAISVVQKVEAACNEIWHVRQERPLARKITDYLSVVLISPVLLFSALAIVASVLASEPVRQLSEIRPLGVLIDLGIRAAPVVLFVITFTFLYKFIPNTRVPILSALVGGIIATVIWVLAGMVFAKFVQSATSYTAIYSALASLILFLIWMNVSWLIVLVGAAVSFYHAHPEYSLLGWREAILSGRDRERLALAIGHTIGKALYAGEGPLTTGALARRLGVPEPAVRDVLRALSAAKLMARTEAQPPRWLPTQPLDAASVKALLDAAREHGNGVGIEVPPGSAKELEHAIDRAVDEALSGWTLRDLALGPEARDSEKGAIASPRPARGVDRA